MVVRLLDEKKSQNVGLAQQMGVRLLDEKKSQHVGLAQQMVVRLLDEKSHTTCWFGSTNDCASAFLHRMLKLAKGTTKLNTSW
jgi:hypothetical protein